MGTVPVAVAKTPGNTQRQAQAVTRYWSHIIGDVVMLWSLNTGELSIFEEDVYVDHKHVKHDKHDKNGII